MRDAAFRGIEFLWREIAIEGGRVSVPHTYPDRTDENGKVTASRDPWIEDPARLPRVMPCIAVFAGDDCDVQAARFLDAIETPGCGTLVHPIYGERQAKAGPYRLRHDQTDGEVLVEVTFHETGTGDLEAEVDYSTAAPSQIDVAAATIVGYYRDVQAAIGFAGAVVTNALAAASTAIDGAETALRSVATPDLAATVKGRLLGLETQVASLIATPEDLADAWREVFLGLPSEDMIRVHTDLLALPLETEPISVATQSYMRGLVLCATATSALETDYEGDRDATEVGALFADAARDAALAAATPEVSGALWTLGAVIGNALDALAGALPRVTTITLPAAMPLGVLVSDLYEDPEYGARMILTRNPTANALFVPAGDVEVVGADFA